MVTEVFTHEDGTRSYYRISPPGPTPPPVNVFPSRPKPYICPTHVVGDLESLPNHHVSYSVVGLVRRSFLGGCRTIRPGNPVESDNLLSYQNPRWSWGLMCGLQYPENPESRDPNLWLENRNPEVCGCGCGSSTGAERLKDWSIGTIQYEIEEWSCRIPSWAVTGDQLQQLRDSGSAND